MHTNKLFSDKDCSFGRFLYHLDHAEHATHTLIVIKTDNKSRYIFSCKNFQDFKAIFIILFSIKLTQKESFNCTDFALILKPNADSTYGIQDFFMKSLRLTYLS